MIDEVSQYLYDDFIKEVQTMTHNYQHDEITKKIKFYSLVLSHYNANNLNNENSAIFFLRLT